MHLGHTVPRTPRVCRHCSQCSSRPGRVSVGRSCRKGSCPPAAVRRVLQRTQAELAAACQATAARAAASAGCRRSSSRGRSCGTTWPRQWRRRVRKSLMRRTAGFARRQLRQQWRRALPSAGRRAGTTVLETAWKVMGGRLLRWRAAAGGWRGSATTGPEARGCKKGPPRDTAGACPKRIAVPESGGASGVGRLHVVVQGAVRRRRAKSLAMCPACQLQAMLQPLLALRLARLH